MQNLVNTYLEKFKRERHVRRRLTCLLLALAMVVSAGVYWQLHLTGAALTNEVYCGLEEHTHTDECYEDVLVCTLEESEGHTHTDDCYETVTTLVCTQEESEGHTHTGDCYDAEGNLTCTLEESEGHTHTEDCYETVTTLVCTLEESEGHTHTEDCYERQLICTKEEHTHTINCMVDEAADVETADIWEATLPELTGVWATDVVAIATSQLGYTESTANFTLDEDGVTRRGYTRYGAWAGNEYGDWDAMFASFCLYYAGISTEDFPEATGAYAWSVTLQGLGFYASAEDDTPLPGDLVFLDADADGKIDRVGIVTAVAEDGALTVIEGNYAEDEADAVCETEYAAGSSAVVGYGFLPGNDTAAAVSEDGDESEVEAEESAVEAEEKSNLLLSVASTEDEGSNSLTATTYKNLADYADFDYSYSQATYSASSGIYTKVAIDFLDIVNNASAFTDGNYSFYYTIPDWLSVDESQIDSAIHIVTDEATGDNAFYYWFEKDSSGNWVVYIVFYDDYVTNYILNEEKDVTKLQLDVWGTISSDNFKVDEEGNVTIIDGTESDGEIDINVEDIDTADNESTLGDISVSKVGKYDSSTNTLTYTITISTVNGTGSINLYDYFYQNITDTGIYFDESILNGYLTLTVTKYATNEEGESEIVDGYPTTETVELEGSNDEGYSNFSLDLDALNAGEYYTITYTMTVVNGSSSLTYSASAVNNVEVSTTISTDDLEKKETIYTSVGETGLSKSGSTDYTDGSVTWTITVNSGKANIANYTLTDEMFSSLTADDLTIKYGSTTATEGTDYTFTYDSEGNITGITFLAVEDTNEDNVADSNTNTYTITYTTSSGQTLGSQASNTAYFAGTNVTSTTGGYSGELEKELNDSATTIDEASNTATLNWTSTITVPEGGIAQGTVLLDYLNDQYTYLYGVPYTHQYYTYDQITALLGSFASSGIIFTDGTNTYTVSANDIDIQVYAFNGTGTSSGGWLTYSNIQDSTAYGSYVFTAWKITFTNDVTFGAGDTEVYLTLNYSTTADLSYVDGSSVTSYQYKNNINVGSLSASDGYTYTNYASIVKTDGDGNTTDSTITISDDSANTLTWIVKVYIPANATYETVTVTDTLPSGVTLSSVSVSTDGSTYTDLTYDSSSSTVSGTNISGTVSGQDVALTIEDDYYSSLTTNGGYVYIRYVCTIDDDVMDELLAKLGNKKDFSNTASVTFDGSSSTSGGDATQTQTVTYDKSAASKARYWDNDNDLLTYYVLINPDEETLNNGENLEVTDTLTTLANESYGYYANTSTVKFWTVTELTGGYWTSYTLDTSYTSSAGTVLYGTYVDSSGNEYTYNMGSSSTNGIYVSGTVTSVTDNGDGTYTLNGITVYQKVEDITSAYTWTYSESISGYTTYHTINASLPDETAILIEYTYQITYVGYTSGTYNFNVSNTVTINGATEAKNSGQESYSEGGTGGSASSGEYRNKFTLIKVKEGYHGTTLTGATYTVYVWNGSEFVPLTYNGTTVTMTTTGSNGEFSFYMYTDDDNNVVTVITDANGTNTYTNLFTYNTAYYLVETTAPDGYTVDSSTRWYIYWSDSDEDTYAVTAPGSWTTSYSYYDLSVSNHSVVAENSPAETTSITVEKAWVDEDENATTVNSGSVTFELYRYTTSSSASSSDGDTGSGGSGSSSSDGIPVYYKTSGTSSTQVATATIGQDFTFTLTFPSYTWYGVYIGTYDTDTSWGSYVTGAGWNQVSGEGDMSFTIPGTYITSSVTGIYIDGECSTYTAVTYKLPSGTLTINKTISGVDSSKASGTTFTVYDSDGNEKASFTYDEMTSGSKSITLTTGTYTIRESNTTVNGYTCTTTWTCDSDTETGSSYSVTISDGQITTVNATNTYTEGVSVDTGDDELVGTYTISASDGWTWSSSSLPATDSNGNTYYYYVKETSTGNSYKIYSYTNNSGIDDSTEDGAIVITNKLTGEEEPDTYTLPSAGGVGVWPYAAAGLALCGGAAGSCLRRKRKHSRR